MSALSLVTTARSVPMRAKPVEVVGLVAILAPTKTSGYYRLTWRNPDGSPGGTSAGRTLTGARQKAEQLDQVLTQAAGGKAMTTLQAVVEDYLSSGVGRNAKTGKDWGQSQLKQMRAKLQRCLRGHGSSRAMDVDRALLDRMRSQAGTRRTRRENATALRGLLRWGATQGYFTAQQAELLPTHLYDLVGEVSGTEAPPRRRGTRTVGQSEDYQSEEDAPSPGQIVRLGEELALLLPTWGRLAPELAADAGPRWSEMFQLTAQDVTVTPAVYSTKGKLKKPVRVHLRIDWQVDSVATAAAKRDVGEGSTDVSAERPHGLGRRKRPKGNKRRRAGVSATSITGYPLHEALLARRDAALQEQQDGTNPEALLFPTETGKMFFYTAFKNDYFNAAATAAGWPYQEWVYIGHRWDEERERWVQQPPQDRIQFDLTWHSLRHRYARTCVDQRKMTAGELMAHGGWENETVVKTLYYNAGEEHFLSGIDKF